MSNQPPVYDILEKGQTRLAKPEVKMDIQKNVDKFKRQNALPPPNQSSKGGIRTRISSKFNRCVESVRKTIRARKGSNKESGAIAVCTKSVLQTRGRTMKRYSRKRLITQKKFRGGATVIGWKKYWDELQSLTGNDKIPDIRRITQEITSDGSLTDIPADQDYIDNILIFALKNESKELLQALFNKGVSKNFMLRNIDVLVEQVGADDATKLSSIRGFVANLS